jgi:hypothetical protein
MKKLTYGIECLQIIEMPRSLWLHIMHKPKRKEATTMYDLKIRFFQSKGWRTMSPQAKKVMLDLCCGFNCDCQKCKKSTGFDCPFAQFVRGNAGRTR